MPDDQQQQQQPPVNLADPAALTAAYQQYLQYLQQVGNQRPAQAPVISQAQLDANRPTSLLGQLGEALGGGAPSDVPMTSDQRERAGMRGLFNFSRGLLGTGTFDSIGQALDRGLTEAERGQYNQEAQVAYGQSAAQDWQRQQMADRLAALKESIPLLQGIQRLNMPSLYGPGGGPGAQAGNAPGTIPGFTARDPKVPTVGQQANNPGNVMADGGLPPGAVGWIPAANGRKVAAYPDIATGIAANAANLASYAGQGVNTVRQAVTKWVGDPKADLGTYIADVATALGVGPDDKIDLTDPKVQAAFITAQQPHETGKSWFTPADVQSGVQLAADWHSGKSKPPGATAPASSPGPAQPATAPPAANAAPGTLTAGASATAAPQGAPLPPGGKPGEVAPVGAGGIGAALNPGATPPVVRAAPSPEVHAEVTGSGIAGRIPGAYNVASLGPVAPPSSATAPATPPPASAQPPAQPGWGTVIGSYGRGPAATAPTPAPPPGVVTPAPQQPPAQQPPQQQPPAPTPAPASRAQDYSVADKDLTPEEYMDRHFVALTPEQVKTYAPGPAGDLAATAAEEVQRERANLATQQQLLEEVRRLNPSEQAAQARQVNEAQGKLDAAENNYNDQVQKLAQAGSKNLLDRDNAERQRVTGNYKADVIDPRNKAAELALQGQQQIALEQVKAGTASQQKVMDSLNESRESARQALDQVDVARTFSRAAGDPTIWQQVQKDHPEFIQWLADRGGLSTDTVKQLGYAGAMDAAMNKLISMARTGSGFQRMTNLDVQILSSQSPQGTDPQAWREAKLSYLQNFMQRQLHYVDTVRSLTAGPNGKSVYDAQKQAESENGPVIPQVPTFTDQPGASASQQRGAWARKNNVTPGTFVLDPEGNLIIAGAPQGGTAQPRSTGPRPPTD